MGGAAAAALLGQLHSLDASKTWLVSEAHCHPGSAGQPAGQAHVSQRTVLLIAARQQPWRAPLRPHIRLHCSSPARAGGRRPEAATRASRACGAPQGHAAPQGQAAGARHRRATPAAAATAATAAAAAGSVCCTGAVCSLAQRQAPPARRPPSLCGGSSRADGRGCRQHRRAVCPAGGAAAAPAGPHPGSCGEEGRAQNRQMFGE